MSKLASPIASVFVLKIVSWCLVFPAAVVPSVSTTVVLHPCWDSSADSCELLMALSDRKKSSSLDWLNLNLHSLSLYPAHVG